MQAGSKEFVGNQYLEFFDTKGVAYVTIKEMNLAHFAKFVSSILSTWPLFLISILMAVDAGILVWLLVRVCLYLVLMDNILTNSAILD